jgi:hypothetical protein
MTGSFEYVNDLADYIKYRIFLDHLKKIPNFCSRCCFMKLAGLLT